MYIYIKIHMCVYTYIYVYIRGVLTLTARGAAMPGPALLATLHACTPARSVVAKHSGRAAAGRLG